MNMDVGTFVKFQNEILESVEKELGRKLSESEKEIFWKISRKSLSKGYAHGKGYFESGWI